MNQSKVVVWGQSNQRVVSACVAFLVKSYVILSIERNITLQMCLLVHGVDHKI